MTNLSFSQELTATPIHLQENLIYTPKPTKGEKLHQVAEKYLESKGYEHADLSMYFPEGEDHHGIGLAFPDHAVCVCFVHGVTFERSPWVDCTTKKQVIEVIDLLLFALESRST